MGAADEFEIRRLAEVVAGYAASMEAWESAELHVLDVMLRERLAALGIETGPNAGAVLMAVAQLLAERPPEWGGDARDTLAEIALLGLRLLEGGSGE